MSKVLLLIVLLKLFLLSDAYCQVADANGTLLWEVSGNGLSKPLYVYGTIHPIEKKDFFLTKSTIWAFIYDEILLAQGKITMSVHCKQTPVPIGKAQAELFFQR